MNTRVNSSVPLVFAVLCLVLVQWTQADRPTGIEETPIVTTSAGRVKGRVLETRLGDKFYAFRGIRYAKPPVGLLRFQVRRKYHA